MRALLVAFLGLTMTAALHVEISVQHIRDRLSGESNLLNRFLNEKWSELGHTGDKISVDFNSLAASNPAGSDFKAIDYTVQGKAGSNDFTAIAHIKLIPSPSYGIYKNQIT